MGKPLVEFSDLFLTHFLTVADQEYVSNYSRQLCDVLALFYIDTSLSETEFIREFTPLGDPHLQPPLERVYVPSYSFFARTHNGEHQWTLRLHRTELSHIAGGIKKQSPPNDPIPSALPHSLVANGLADVVAFTSMEEGGSKGSGRAGSNLTLTGTRWGMYLYLKIESLSELHKKFRWDAETGAENWSHSFISSLVSAFGDDAQSVVILSFDEIERVNEFVAECNAEALSRVTRDELEYLLQPTGINLQEWLKANV